MAALVDVLIHQSCKLQVSTDFAVTYCDSLPVLHGAESQVRSLPSSEVWVKRYSQEAFHSPLGHPSGGASSGYPAATPHLMFEDGAGGGGWGEGGGPSLRPRQ